MGSQHPIRKIVTPEVPDKLYFRIGDVARLCEVPAYVLRFWETEFPQLKPNKGGTGQRLYRKRDVETALRIKSLLYDQGYTIPGARQVFKSELRIKDILPAAPEESALRPVAPGRAARSDGHAPHPEADEHAAAPKYDASRDVAALSALREDMRSLLRTLSAPVADLPTTALAVSAGQAPRLQTLRPRLVTDSGGLSPSATLDPLLNSSRSGD